MKVDLAESEFQKVGWHAYMRSMKMEEAKRAASVYQDANLELQKVVREALISRGINLDDFGPVRLSDDLKSAFLEPKPTPPPPPAEPEKPPAE